VPKRRALARSERIRALSPECGVVAEGAIMMRLVPCQVRMPRRSTA
jgi:hypothetical protein